MPEKKEETKPVENVPATEEAIPVAEVKEVGKPEVPIPEKPEENSAQKPEAPVPEKTDAKIQKILTAEQSKEKAKGMQFDGTGWALVSILLIGLMYSLYVGYQAMEKDDEIEAVASTSDKSVATPTPPALNLNYPHRRQGQPITVNPDIIGKTDPFTK